MADRWDIEIEAAPREEPLVPGDTVSGTVRFERERAAEDVRLLVHLAPYVVSPRGGSAIYAHLREAVLYEGPWAAGQEKQHGFQLVVPPGPPSWVGKHLRVEWRLCATAHGDPTRDGERGEAVVEVALPSGSSFEFEAEWIEPPREGGCGLVAVGFANLLTAMVVVSMFEEAPFIASATGLAVAFLDAGLIASNVSAARRRLLSATRVSTRVVHPRGSYRDEGSGGPQLELQVSDLPPGASEVKIELRAVEHWLEPSGSRSFEEERPVFEEQAVLQMKPDGSFVASLPLPDVHEVGFSAGDWASGVRWTLLLEVTQAKRTLRASYALVTRPAP